MDTSRSTNDTGSFGTGGTGGTGGGTHRGEGTRSEGAETVCVFWLGERAYGISTDFVGEVVAIDSWVPVPGSHAAVEGLFNLRGAPVALIDMVSALELPEASVALDDSVIALVLRRDGGPIAGLVIDRMESVVRYDQGRFAARDWAAEHAVVSGFLDMDDRELVVTLLDPEVVTDRLHDLSFQ